MLISDIKRKSVWMYGQQDRKSILKVCLSDGTSAMILFRASAYLSRYTLLKPLALVTARLNMVLNGVVIGRGANVGRGFVIMHSVGVVINGNAIIGKNCTVQSGVVVGSVNRESPTLGDDVHLGAGAKVLGNVQIGDSVSVGANAVVVSDLPSGSTAVGIPAKVIKINNSRIL